jgi:hypothetical protein
MHDDCTPATWLAQAPVCDAETQALNCAGVVDGLWHAALLQAWSSH